MSIDLPIPLLAQYYSILSNMQKHEEWVSNRGYLRHMEVLKKIQTRRADTNSSRRLPHPQQDPPPSLQRKSHQDPTQPFLRSKENISIRDQQILWDNYCLGKRIIQTPPVISKRRLDQDYIKHKQLVKCLTATGTRKAQSDFRVKKLQQYKQNVEHSSEDKAIGHATHSRWIRIQIKCLAFYRQKPMLDQLSLLFTYGSREGKVLKQTSESFPAQNLINRHFYFAVSKRLVQKEEPLSIEIQNLKGLTQLSVGYFSFPCAASLDCYKAQVFHCGKAIGEVQLSTFCGKKQETIKLPDLPSQ